MPEGQYLLRVARATRLVILRMARAIRFSCLFAYGTGHTSLLLNARGTGHAGCVKLRMAIAARFSDFGAPDRGQAS